MNGLADTGNIFSKLHKFSSFRMCFPVQILSQMWHLLSSWPWQTLCNLNFSEVRNDFPQISQTKAILSWTVVVMRLTIMIKTPNYEKTSTGAISSGRTMQIWYFMLFLLFSCNLSILCQFDVVFFSLMFSFYMSSLILFNYLII